MLELFLMADMWFGACLKQDCFFRCSTTWHKTNHVHAGKRVSLMAQLMFVPNALVDHLVHSVTKRGQLLKLWPNVCAQSHAHHKRDSAQDEQGS